MSPKGKFEFFNKVEHHHIPKNRLPASGIELLKNYVYHPNLRILNSNPDQPLTGPEPVKGVADLINSDFIPYSQILKEYCRPKTNADAIFEDFNSPQIKTVLPKDRFLTDTLSLLDHFMAIKPYDIVHWCDTRFYNWTFSSRADYFHIHSKSRNEHAKHSHPEDKVRPTTKGYFVNAHLHHDRSTTHQIKHYGFPFVPKSKDTNESRLNEWLLKHPTELLVRSHISKRDKLKVRPVYNAPYLLVRLELMLIWPMLAQCRSPENSLMYGLETMRGGMAEIKRIACDYKSFVILDWSKFDHDAPFSVIDTFFTHFLPSKVCIDKGYARINNYREHISNFDKQAEGFNIRNARSRNPFEVVDFKSKVSNLIKFVHTWIKKMIFITPDGYAYRRRYAGIPSGILSTQLLDSYVNIFVLNYLMLKFGLTVEEIKSCKLLILGDDVALFTPFSVPRMESMFSFMKTAAKQLFNMTINAEKSKVSGMRSSIEILGYSNIYGYPYKNIEKLVAQLCYPEHHVNDEIMCARAVGIVLASAGIDLTFYNLCDQVYRHYLAKLQQPPGMEVFLSMLHRMFRYIPQEEASLILPKIVNFPTLDEIRMIYSVHLGYLTIDHFWSKRYFLDPPLAIRSFKTLH